MYVKTSNNEIVTYPYSVEQFRADNPNTSFPAEMSDDFLAGHNIYPVGYQSAPSYDVATQNMVVSSQPSLIDGSWVLTKSVVDKTAKQIEEYNARKESEVRDARNALLAETDYYALSDVTMSAEMTTYRQALRDMPSQSGFPHTVTWPTKPV